MTSSDEDMEDILMEEDEKDIVVDCSNPDVVTKYQLAAGIANRAMQLVIKSCKPGMLIVDLCDIGDNFILREVSKIFNKGKVDKGIAFPTSVSLNNIAGHYSPLAGDKTTLRKGDLAKIDLGVHIDGFAALTAESIVLSDEPITGRKADVLAAVKCAQEAALRLVAPGRKNSDVTKAFMKIAEDYHVQPLHGVLSHEMRQFVIDGKNTIIGRVDVDAGHKVDEFEFQTNETYAIDIVMSTGEGKTREMDEQTTVFKRAVDQSYNLKMKASRYVLTEIDQRFPTFPFTIRALEDKRAKLGIVECRNHELVSAYPVLYEKDGEFVAQVKFTVLLLSSGQNKITNTPQINNIQSEYSLQDEDLKTLIAQPLRKKKRRKKKKKKKSAPKPDAMEIQ